MKKLLMLSTAAVFFACAACKDNNSEETTTTDSMGTSSMEMNGNTAAGSYVDLRSGRPVSKDAATGRYVDDAGSPADFYVDMNTNDTFYGQTGQKVNNALLYENGDWKLDESKLSTPSTPDAQSGDYKLKTEDGKVKSEDGEVKVK